MALLISSKEVLDLAFSSVDHMTEGVIKETKIEAAQEKFLRPVFGKMFENMVGGGYAEFVDGYIKKPLAYYVRYGVIPDMSIKMGNTGPMAAYTDHANAATDKQREMLRKQAIDDADALLRKAVRYMEAHPDEFPDYELGGNVQRKVITRGGIILT